MTSLWFRTNDKLEENFNSLKKDDPIRKGIVRAIRDLQKNAFSGIQVPKRLIPKEYMHKYEINNCSTWRNY